MKRFHFLLFALSGIMFLLSINRLTSFTSGYVISNEFLRWSDFNALIIISLITVFIFYLLIRNIVSGPIIKSVWWINILLLTGVYLFGAGTGVHEVTNYLNSRFCTHSIINEKICSIIRFNDDEFSHYVYFIGFILMNVSAIFFESYNPRSKPFTKLDQALISVNALLIALGIFINSAFENIGLDLYVFGFIGLISFICLLNKRKTWRLFPITYYSSLAYLVGTFSIILVTLFQS